MQDMNCYYDFSGQKFGYPLSLSINSFQRQVFTRQSSLEISYVLKGEYEAITEHFTTVLKEHEMIIIAPNDTHMLRQSSDGNNIILTVHIDFDRFSAPMVGDIEESLESLLCTKTCNYPILSKLRCKLGELITMLIHNKTNICKMNCIMCEMIYIASNHLQYPIEHLPFQSTHRENYMKAIRYIDQHYEEELYLEDIANTLSFSTSYASKLFKKYTNIPFVKYLAYVRVRASFEGLLEGKDTIEQLATACGMPSSKAYTTTFKELYGITPSAYRKKFTQNLRMNPYKEDEVMKLNQEQIELVEHLLLDTQDVLYENNGIRIRNRDGHIVCRIQLEPNVKTYTSQNSEELIIEVMKEES